MKLDKNSKFIRLLENALRQWKDENGIERPFFYNIDFDKNVLVLYSDDPPKLIRNRDDLDEILSIADLRFKSVHYMQFKGGVIA